MSFAMIQHPRTLILKRSTSMTIYTTTTNRHHPVICSCIICRSTMPTTGIARHAHNMHQFIYPKPQKLVQLTKSCAYCSAPIAKHLKFCNQSCAALFNNKLRPAGSESRSKGNESRKLKCEEHNKTRHINRKYKHCTNCNTLFQGKNRTCSPECAKIRSSAGSNAKKNVNRRTQEMIMTGAIHPTYLYIKEHSITGLKYFGKTCRNPYKYNGSGQHWMPHIKKHGRKHVVTNQVFGPFTDAAIISKFALAFSAEHNIAASKDWANMEPENGLNGAQFGRIFSDESKQKRANTILNKNLVPMD